MCVHIILRAGIAADTNHKSKSRGKKCSAKHKKAIYSRLDNLRAKLKENPSGFVPSSTIMHTSRSSAVIACMGAVGVLPRTELIVSEPVTRPIHERMDSAVPQTRARTSRGKAKASLHVLQKQATSLADRWAEQLSPYHLRPDGSKQSSTGDCATPC